MPKITQDVKKRDDKTRTFASASRALPELFQDVKKRDDKARTFALQDNNEVENLAELTKSRLKVPDPIESNSIKRIFAEMKSAENLERAKFLENINKYESINLNDVNNLIDEMEKNIVERYIADLGNNKKFYFRDLFNFLHDIKDGKISDFN